MRGSGKHSRRQIWLALLVLLLAVLAFMVLREPTTPAPGPGMTVAPPPAEPSVETPSPSPSPVPPEAAPLPESPEPAPEAPGTLIIQVMVPGYSQASGYDIHQSGAPDRYDVAVFPYDPDDWLTGVPVPGGWRTYRGEDAPLTMDGLAPGEYVVAARARGLAVSYGIGRVQPGGEDQVIIYLGPAGRGDTGVISGQVLNGLTGEPVTEFDICKFPNSGGGAGLSGMGFGAVGPNVPHDAAWESRRDPEGRFRLTGVGFPQAWGVAARSARFAPAMEMVRLQPDSPHQTVVIRLMDPGVTLEGKVVDPEGAPVRGASVYLGQVRDKFVGTVYTADARGAFTITGLGPEIVVTAQHPGYVPATQRFEGQAGETARGEIVLEPAGTIMGRVTRGGEPMAGWRVALQPRQNGRNTLTDAEGNYAVQGLRPGQYSVLVRIPHARSHIGSGFVSLAAGETLRADFDVPLGHAQVYGKVSVFDAPPRSADLWITVLTASADFEANTSADAEGNYQFDGLPAGLAALRVRAKPSEGRALSTAQSFHLAEGAAVEADFSLGETGVLHGTVSGREETENAVIIALPGVHVIDGLDTSLLTWFNAMSDQLQQELVDQDEYRWPSLAPGPYTVLCLTIPKEPVGEPSIESLLAEARMSVATVQVVAGQESTCDFAF